jgi:hypothetical protein
VGLGRIASRWRVATAPDALGGTAGQVISTIQIISTIVVSNGRNFRSLVGSAVCADLIVYN